MEKATQRPLPIREKTVEQPRFLLIQAAGLGNAILTTPLIQALSTLSPKPIIDVAIKSQRGSGLIFQDWSPINQLLDWSEVEAWSADKYEPYTKILVCDLRKLPTHLAQLPTDNMGIPPKTGDIDRLWLFEKHEADCLLDMARRLGFRGKRPPLRHPLPGDSRYALDIQPNTVAIGIGYYKGLRNDGRDWRDRHWGNERFLALCHILRENGFNPVLVGDQKDYDTDGWALAEAGIESICGKLTLPQVIHYLSRCRAYIGNDTGLMHVAAAQEIPTLGIFVHTNSIKSYPLGSRCLALGGDEGPRTYDVDEQQVWAAFQTLLRK